MATDRERSLQRLALFGAVVLFAIWIRVSVVDPAQAARASVFEGPPEPDTVELLVFSGSVVSFGGEPCVVREISRVGDRVTLDVRCVYREVDR